MRNSDFVVEGDIAKVKIKSKKFGEKEVLIDVEDFIKLDKKIVLSPKENERFYCKILSNGKNVYLHRFLMNCPDGKVVDHINGNPLDNRKANLRICSQVENMQNQKVRINNKSGLRGISYDKMTRKWNAQIMVNKKQVWRKKFNSRLMAELEIERARKLLGVA